MLDIEGTAARVALLRKASALCAATP
jgi:hypothetical protein